MEEDAEDGEDNKRRKSGEKTESLSYYVPASVKAAKMMMKKNRAETERGSAGCCQMKTTSNQPFTVC